MVNPFLFQFSTLISLGIKIEVSNGFYKVTDSIFYEHMQAVTINFDDDLSQKYMYPFYVYILHLSCQW